MTTATTSTSSVGEDETSSTEAPKPETNFPKRHQSFFTSKLTRSIFTSIGLSHLPYITTSIHLRAELALLICNILLVAASSHNLYKNAYLTNSGDWKYLLAVSFWLGRHVFLRAVCTLSWVDVGSTIGERNVVNGLGWNRRRDFEAWAERQRHQYQGRSLFQMMYRWLRGIVGLFSPFNLMATLVRLIQQYAMGGQYCDGSAARGVASAAMMMYGGSGGNFGGGGDDSHGSKTNKHVSHHHGVHSLHTQSMETHTIAMLFLARVWGTMCALSSALWALLRRGDVGGETFGLIGGTFCGWIKSCLAIVRPTSSTLDQHLGNNTGSKKSRRKQQHSIQSTLNDPRVTLTGSSEHNSLDFMNGKLQLTFELFPDHIRSRAIHIQQMRTSEMFITLQKAWVSFPPAQFQIAIVTLTILLQGWLFQIDGGYYHLLFRSASSDEDNVTIDSILPNFGFHRSHSYDEHSGNNGANQAAYWNGLTQPRIPDIFHSTPPSFITLLFRIVSFGTAASLLCYGRLLLPIPEFVAGTNVLKAVRAEARSLGAGAAGKNISKQNKDLPWVERYKSITMENRLRLYYKVGMIRIIENVLLCAILPQTEVVCRITEHCEPGPLLWGASGVTGISGSRYTRGSFDALMKDPFITRTTVLVMAFLSAFLLIAQMTVMNRTYLAIMGYICGEWKLVREETSNEKNSFFGKHSGAAPIRRSSNSTIMQWDPKRRYQKGDRISFDYCVYEAMSNSPEGPPFDTYLRAAHDLYNDELGHRSNSTLLSNTSMGCWVFVSVLCGAMFFWKNAGWNFFPLLLMSTACAIAGSVIAHLGDSCSGIITDLAKEIDKGHKLINNAA
eukprot:CCRYP_018570-RA/>CCRYP_018570-RA protein AED:0.29 eAED:0.29 QI:0/-1/0/1/-1/1/1/0/838